MFRYTVLPKKRQMAWMMAMDKVDKTAVAGCEKRRHTLIVHPNKSP